MSEDELKARSDDLRRRHFPLPLFTSTQAFRLWSPDQKYAYLEDSWFPAETEKPHGLLTKLARLFK